MVIGRHEPREAKDTDLKKAIFIGLDEATTALEESFHDLTDGQFWSFQIEGRHNIVTLVEHCLDCLDLYCCEVQTGQKAIDHETRFDIWHFSPGQLRDKMVNLPSVASVRKRLASLKAAALAGLETATEAELTGPRNRQSWFWEKFHKTSADAYFRAIEHTNAHLRQIWLMRGLMGLMDRNGWPEQHWA